MAKRVFKDLCFVGLKAHKGCFYVAIVQRDTPGEILIKSRTYSSLKMATVAAYLMNRQNDITEKEATEILCSSVRADNLLKPLMK